MFESWNQNLTKVVAPEPETCLQNHCERAIKWQLGSTCITRISGWGCSIQAGLY